MKSGESANRYNQQTSEYNEKYGHHDGQLRQILLVEQHEHQTQTQYDEYVYGERDEKEQKVFVVAARYTIAHPWTMMIHGVNASVTHATMRATWRPVELTRGAPLHAHVYVVYEHVFVVATCLQLLVEHVLVLGRVIDEVYFGKATRVHERGDGEVKYYVNEEK